MSYIRIRVVAKLDWYILAEIPRQILFVHLMFRPNHPPGWALRRSSKSERHTSQNRRNSIMKILLFEPQSDEQLAKNTMVATVNYRNLQAAQEALIVDYERALLKKLKVARQETKRLTPF